MKYDFIVIGAGLSGSYFTDLSSKYSSVLLIDKGNLERKYPHGVVFEKHNNYFFDINNPLPLENKEIFPKVQYQVTYSGKEHEGTVDGKEFGGPVGYFCNLHKLNEFLNIRAEKNGAKLLFNTLATGIHINNEGVIVDCDNNQQYKADVVVFATGSGIFQNDPKENLFQLQTSIGFEKPDLYYGVFTRFYAEAEYLIQNIPTDYRYHYNRKISPCGPLFTTRWESGNEPYFDIGILHNDINEASQRLIAVIKRYKNVEKYFQNAKPTRFPDCEQVENISIIKKVISKHNVKKKVKNRAILIGESAGLVTSFFYEGTTGCVCSAKIASDILHNLIEKNNPEKYSDRPEFLGQYDIELNKKFVNTYYKGQHGGETLWIDSGDAGEIIFNTYAKLLSQRKDLRKYVYDALVLDNLEKYNFQNDITSGEEMFKALPLSLKVLYSPYFLKAKFS